MMVRGRGRGLAFLDFGLQLPSINSDTAEQNGEWNKSQTVATSQFDDCGWDEPAVTTHTFGHVKQESGWKSNDSQASSFSFQSDRPKSGFRPGNQDRYNNDDNNRGKFDPKRSNSFGKSNHEESSFDVGRPSNYESGDGFQNKGFNKFDDKKPAFGGGGGFGKKAFNAADDWVVRNRFDKSDNGWDSNLKSENVFGSSDKFGSRWSSKGSGGSFRKENNRNKDSGGTGCGFSRGDNFSGNEAVQTGKKQNNNTAGFGSNDDADMPRGGGYKGFGSGGNRSGGGSNCFKCGEPGHMARDCTSSENKGRSGSGFGGGNCFKCGESGHLARECPNADEREMSLEGKREAPYVPPPPPEDEPTIFLSIPQGINFDKYDQIPVEVTGRCPPPLVNNFEEAGLHPQFLGNVKKAKYEKPTPVQKYAIPIIMEGRDLMACAQTGSGKTAAFLLPVLMSLVKNGVPECEHKIPQEPLVLIVAPTRELAVQIFMDARKFAYGSCIRPVVLYGGTSVSSQIRNVSVGCHIVVATPGRLVDLIEKSVVSLSSVKHFILDEADRMLDMGFEPEIRKLVNSLGMLPKTERQTLMFSATFPDKIQSMAADFLQDYLFLTVGIVGSACSDVEQQIFQVDRQEKRQKLCTFLEESGKNKTLVFVEQKRNADFLASYLSQSGYLTTSIHGDRLQREREEALFDFKSGRTPVLIATSVAARGLDIPHVDQVVNYDLPQTIDEYVHRIGRTGRCGNIGKAVSFYSEDSDSALARGLLKVFSDAQQNIPPWLEKSAQSAVICGGGFGGNSNFGGRDLRGTNFGNKKFTMAGSGEGSGWDAGANTSSMFAAATLDEEGWD